MYGRLIRLMMMAVLCTSAASFGTISFSNNTLTYSSTSDLSSTIDPSGQKEVTNSYGVSKASFQALTPQIVAFDGAPTASQTLRYLVANYDATHTVTFTFPADMYNYGSYTSMGRGAFSGSALQDAISTVPVLNGSLYDWFDATISCTGIPGVQSLGFCAAFRSEQAVAAGQVLYTLSDDTTEAVTLPALGNAGNPEYVFIGYTAPTGKTITRIQASRTSTAGGGYVSIDDLSFVMSPVPTVTLSRNYASIAEAGGVCTLTATLSATASQNVTVDLDYTGQAIQGTDFAAADSITITAGNLTGTTNITATQDTLYEGNETVVVDITSVTNAEEVDTQQVSTSITDDDSQPTVTLSRNNATIAEAAGVSTLTATLSNASTQDVTVTLTHTGTATGGGTDYTAASSITVTAGNLTGTTDITASQDSIYEGNETVITDITGVTNGTEYGTQQVTVTITEDDSQPAVTLSRNNATIAEAAGVSTLTATLSNTSTQDVTVNLGYTGTATGGGTDYTAASSITVTAGQLTGTTDITAVQDGNMDASETVIVDITSVTNGTESGGMQQVTVTIADDDSGGIFAFKRSSTAQDEENLTNARFDSAPVRTVTVNDGQMYGDGNSRWLNYGTSTSATAYYCLYKFDLSSIPAGSTINLAQLRLYRSGGNSGTGDMRQVLTHDWTEGTKNGAYPGLSGGARGASFTHPNGKNTTYNRNSEDGTSTPWQSWGTSNDAFFSMTSDCGAVINPSAVSPNGAGWHVYTVTDHVQDWVDGTLPNYGWAQSRGNWAFYLSENTAAKQPVLFVDYTPPPPTVTLTRNNASIAEAAGICTLTATLNYAISQDVTVDLDYTGTATQGTDYTAANSITVTAGNLAGTTNITATQDTLYEGDETVVVDITSVTNGTESGTQQVSTSITEDDAQPTVTLSRNPSSIAEAAGVSTLTATLNHASTQDVTVTLTHTGTAGTGDRTVAGSIVVSAGSLSNTTNITAIQDAIYEGNETVITDITGVSNGTESGTQSVTTTITDDDSQPTVTLSQDLSSIVEDGGVSTLTATLSNASYQNVTVNLAYTPTAGTDFTAAGSIVINAGSLSNTTALTALTDSSSEGDETITVEVSSVTNGTESGTQLLTVTILDDDNPTVIALKRHSGTLSTAGGIASQFTTATVVTTTVNDTCLYTTANNGRWYNCGITNPAAHHYVLYKFDVSSIPAGSTINLAQLRLYRDLGNGTGDSLGQILTHDWIEGTKNWIYPGSAGGASAAHPAGYNASYEQNADGTTASPHASWGAASSSFFSMGGDVSTSLETPSRSTSSGVGYHLYDVTDHVQEWVSGTKPNYGWAQARGSWAFYLSECSNQSYEPVLFVDFTPGMTPPDVTLTVSPSSFVETGGTATLTATISHTYPLPVTVTLGYSGTAIRNTDYTANTSITVPAGQTSGTTVITATGDGSYEGNETIIVDITAVTNGMEADVQQVTATLVDDDASPPSVHLTINQSSFSEEGGTAIVTAILSNTYGQNVTVNLGYTASTATLSTDFTAPSSIVVASGQTTNTGTITGLHDTITEGNETVVVDITSVTNGTEQGTQQVSATITDDDGQMTSNKIALKRDGGALNNSGNIDHALFDAAVVVPTTVKDATLCSNQSSRWMNGGANTTAAGANYALYKFDLTSIPAYSKINKAQLRLYHTAGNGFPTLGGVRMVLTHDWLEGTGTGIYGAYPGQPGGVSYAHPAGKNSSQEQNADGTSAQPHMSWRMTSSPNFLNTSIDAGTLTDPSSNPTGVGYHVYDITGDVQKWVSGTKFNYGWVQANGSWNFHMSEIGAYYQPVLFIDYQAPTGDATPPAVVSNLAVSTATSSSQLTVTWTAPGDDGTTGIAASYELRYSKSAITFENWGAATLVSPMSIPQAHGSSESAVVMGLAQNTTYYFALKTFDEVGNCAGMTSNASRATLADTTAPSTVTLAVSDYGSDFVTLSWTAPGDDSTTGRAATYDIRYSTSTINNDTTWNAATQATGEQGPEESGQPDSFTVPSLTAGQTYYFAMKAADEVPNWSARSNCVSQQTTADITRPAAITNLSAVKAKSSAVKLSWTTPGDDGSTGTARTYDVRYRTGGAVNDSNWATATQVTTGEPAALAAGNTQTMWVHGLSATTTYYFAIKTADEVPNWSLISNSPSLATLANTAINKPLLRKEDFTYQGAFKLPIKPWGYSTMSSRGGLALRTVGGQLRMLLTSGSIWGNRVFEVTVPDSSTWVDGSSGWPEASLTSTNWARNVYGGMVEYYGTDTEYHDTNWVTSLMYDSTSNPPRLYFSWGPQYGGGTNENCLGWADLSTEGEPIAHGPWKDTQDVVVSHQMRGGTTMIPTWFATDYLGGRKLGVGFGGMFSVGASASFGPCLTAVQPPQDGTNDLDCLRLLYYPYNPAHYCSRDANYSLTYATDRTQGGPGYCYPPSGNTGTWLSADNIWGAGIWIDLSDKQGMMFLTSRAHGTYDYANGQPYCGWSEWIWMVYDPDDLRQVAQGTMNSWAPAHDDWAMTFTPEPLREYNIGYPRGVAFDPDTRTLFVEQQQSYQSGVEFYPLIHCYHIN